MKNTELYFGDALLNQADKEVSLDSVDINDETYFKIENYNQMTPFFMTIVSDVDFWMFISSTGGLTAGRKNQDNALFPYYTDDKIHDSADTTGSHTMAIVSDGHKNYLWKPFSKHNSDVYKITRNIYKNTIGNKIMFEEINHDLNVTFRYTWKTSNRYGFVKESEIVNTSGNGVTVRVLDGIRNILPYGVETLLQTTRSTLADGYKRCELVEKSGLGIFNLSSIISDKAEPSEALKATTVWSKGLKAPKYLLSELQVDDFCLNKDLDTEFDIKGRRGAFYVSDTFELAANESKDWFIVSELHQSAVDIHGLIDELNEEGSLVDNLNKDILLGDENLKRLVFEADGFQMTDNKKVGYRHFSNTLYNIMRGGIYADGYLVDTDDLREFIMKWNSQVYDRHSDFLNAMESKLDYNSILEAVKGLGDTDLERLALEYLPLTYSRRHGDPSRPWNKFSIEISKDNGDKNLNFEGNWRDIFQNWEALSLSYPAYIESIIAKFVNASTADGYNPYRITKDGIDWELMDPEDPWSNIGYWGDHQIIYLLKLLELSKKYNAGKLMDLLGKDIFVYANVPYRIKGFDSLLKDPRNSIAFDDACEETVGNRVKSIGADGKLIFKDQELYHVNLVEKLLVTLLSKLSNFVPEGGIWMNTQRPEWNDANNALVGYGVSMVTLYYLHRYLGFMEDLLSELNADVQVSVEVQKMLEDTLKVLDANKKYLGNDISDEVRFQVVNDLGRIGETYREAVYCDGFSGEKSVLSIKTLKDFIATSKDHLKDTIVKNKREDGLYNAYNLISFSDKTAKVSYLYEMLEGQVAVLSANALNVDETLDVLKALKESAIFREDQNSYMLYPNRELPEFLEKNIVPIEMVMSSKVLKKELEIGSTRFIEKDINGNYHFNGVFRNSDELMEAIEGTNDYNSDDIAKVGEMFTDLFDHHSFTGRSGTFYKYEGLGCIYWHMVSKLVLSAQEAFQKVASDKGMSEEARRLGDYFHELKAGVGVEKSPLDYGAFPTDAYSHTPGFAGVQQPGMTGQVKEDFISRFGELGVNVNDGEINFQPLLLSKDEFLKSKVTWDLPNGSIDLIENQLGFTVCSVPVIYTLSDEMTICIYFENGDKYKFDNTSKINKEISQSIFNREGKIEKIVVKVKM